MERFDCIIIGGGIIGCSIAYHLARDGVGRVLVVERNELASAASSLAAGLILQVTTKPAKTALVQATCRAITELEVELDEAAGFHRVGSLRIASAPERMLALQDQAVEAERNGIAVEWLTHERARAMVAWLDLPDGSGVLHMPEDGYADPYLLTMAYARAARKRGVTFRPRTAVTGIVVDDGRAAAVEADGARIAGGTLVDAAGAWAAVVSAQAGFALPMAPVRSHYWICEADAAFAGDHPVTVLSDAAAYTRPETGGLVLGVQEARSRTFDARDLPSDSLAFSATAGEEHWDVLAEGAAAVHPYFPGIMTARFSGYVAGLSSYTPDGNILLGAVPGVEGLLAAAGCCGSGVALSGGIGEAVSCLVRGETPAFDIAPFDPGRFGATEPFSDEFREQCARARATKLRPTG